MPQTKIVSHQAWRQARIALLAKEKELTRLRDELAAARRDLPWEPVEKSYSFTGPAGPVSLADLFGTCSQLIVQHFMLAPGWQEGCPHCSFWADGYDGIVPHLRARDTAFVTVSLAPMTTITAYAARMGWRFPWYSSNGSNFNFDYHVSFTPEGLSSGDAEYNYTLRTGRMTELPGISVFARDAAGAIFHTYSCYGRGLDSMNVAYQYLDLTPKGRDEDGLPYPMAWVRRHDSYPPE